MAATTKGEGLAQFFALRMGAHIFRRELSYDFDIQGQPDQWFITTATDYAKMGRALTGDRVDEVWLRAEGPEGQEADIALRKISTDELWLTSEKVLDDFVYYMDESRYFRCMVQRQDFEPDGSQVHLVPKWFDCRTCPNHLACVTKGWLINVP